VPEEIEEAIRKGIERGCLPCKTAWHIAEDFGIHKSKIGAICDALGIKIKPCQLGAF
jgi:hypothetical protein